MNLVEKNRHSIGLIASALIFFFMSSALVLHDGVGGSAGLLLIMSLTCLGFLQNRAPLSTAERLWVVALIAFFLSGLISTYMANVLEENFLHSLDVPSRFLLVIPVFFLLRSLPLKPGVFWWGVVVGAVSAAIYASYQRIHLGMFEARGGVNHHITFGGLALSLGFISMAGFSYFSRYRLRGFRWGWIIPLLGLGGGVVASILSGSRGGWISIPALCGFLIWMNRHYLSRWMIVGLVLLPIALGVAAYNIPSTNIKYRIQVGVSEADRYFKNGDHSGSLNHRFEMFKAAWLIFLDNPMVGAGTSSFRKEANQLWEKGKIRRIGDIFTHPHNEYLSAMSMRGIVGLLAVLLLFACPLYYLFPVLLHTSAKPYAAAGILLNIGYIHYAMSEAILDRMVSVMFYLFLMSIIFAYVRQELDNSQVAKS